MTISGRTLKFRSRPVAWAGGIAGLLALTGPAWGQYSTQGSPYTGGLLPSLGGDYARVGDLRPALQSYFNDAAPSPPGTPAWLFYPSLGVDVGATDNALRTESPKRGDLFTVISPSIFITGDTARLRVNLSYTPVATIYASQSSQTQVSHFFNGQALAAIVPNAVFVDLRGSVGVTSLTGYGNSSASDPTYNRQNSVQTISFSVTPYAEHRFAGWGTARVGYSFLRTLQDQQDQQNQNFGLLNNVNTNTALLGTPGYGTVGNLSTQRERASFVTGENFGRWNDIVVVQATQYSGGGSYRGAYRNEISNELGYALTRQITLLGGLGYQDIRYAGAPPIQISEPTWNAGFRYTLNPDSSVTVLYGRRDGITSVSLDGQYAPTARTRVFLRYSTGLTSDIEDAQNVLSTTSVGPTGLLTDTATGAPVGGYSGFGVQNGIFKVRRLSATGLLLQNRDSYTVSVTNEDRTSQTATPTLFNNQVVPAGTSSNSLSVTGSWQHDLAPDMSTLASASYAVTNNTQQYLGLGNGSQRTVQLSAALSKQFTETLSGTVRYTFTDQSGGSGNNFQAVSSNGLLFNRGSYTENLLLVGLRKRF